MIAGAPLEAKDGPGRAVRRLREPHRVSCGFRGAVHAGVVPGDRGVLS